MNIVEKIKQKKARCAVIGLGYVGLPLAVELAEAGLEVVGIDLDKSKVDAINAKRSYIQDVPRRR
jgi:UDP-N-acetyl-D-glucosamine dehydrogenase